MIHRTLEEQVHEVLNFIATTNVFEITLSYPIGIDFVIEFNSIVGKDSNEDDSVNAFLELEKFSSPYGWELIDVYVSPDSEELSVISENDDNEDIEVGFLSLNFIRSDFSAPPAAAETETDYEN